MKRVKQEYKQRQEDNNLHIFNIFLSAGEGQLPNKFMFMRRKHLTKLHSGGQ